MLDELGRQTLVIAAMVVLVGGPVAAAALFLQRRKRQVRQRRRSPLTQDLLRAPGQALRERLEETQSDLGIEVAFLVFVPMLPLALFQISSLITGRSVSVGAIGFTLVAAMGFVAWQIRKLVRTAAVMDRLRLGLDAELAVGQELDQLMREGAVVFHDVPGEKFNVDHVVVAPQGIFAVETKGYSKPAETAGKAGATVVFDGKALVFPEYSGIKAIEQARRQAKWLADWLARATGEPVDVVPVLALPGWFVERKGRGDVHVFSGKELRIHLLGLKQAQPVGAEQMQRVAHQLEQRCRTVRPEYRAEDASI
jgi:hypothetical protein